MSDAVPKMKSAPLDFSGTQGRAYYPRDRSQLEKLLAALPADELALVRFPSDLDCFSTRADPQQIVNSGYDCNLCHGPVREDELGAKIYQWCKCSLLVTPAQHFHLVDSTLWTIWCCALTIEGF
jgi:hypothetical protein